jgi:hypothetical protein
LLCIIIHKIETWEHTSEAISRLSVYVVYSLVLMSLMLDEVDVSILRGIWPLGLLKYLRVTVAWTARRAKLLSPTL